MKFIPAIVIVAFNRPDSLRRLLHSIDVANYPEGVEVPLCICIDYQESQARSKVVEIAREFIWEQGPKEVILQSSNLGLKAHVLLCGDLTERFGSIIMLEDDLYVSPDFYTYSHAALSFYDRDESIGGVSLYAHALNFNNRKRFIPHNDGHDVFFLQIASSWGQVWSSHHWQTFRTWLAKEPEISPQICIPDYVRNWPDKSWLKHKIAFLHATGKFYVYPRVSFTTNFGDQGENNSIANTLYQVPLATAVKTITFTKLTETTCCYDSFFEITSDSIRKLCPDLAHLDVTVNLYGLKSPGKITTEYVLSSIPGRSPLHTFGRHLKPHELNIVNKIDGDDFFLVRREDLMHSWKPTVAKAEAELQYYYSRPQTKVQLKSLLGRLKGKIFNR